LKEPEIVWLTEERRYAEIIYRGAYFSYVKYTLGGIEFEVLIENDDYVFREEYPFEHESE